MAHFVRAAKEASRHWLALVAAFSLSLGVAALWGANIAALFPIIETTLHGQSLQTWNKQRLEKAEGELTDRLAKIARLETQIAAANPHERSQLDMQRGALLARIKVNRATVYSAKRLQPYLERFLPVDPFPTVIVVVTFVVVATLLKQLCALSNTLIVAHVSQTIAMDIRNRLFSKALALDRHGFNAQGTSGFTASITHTTDMLAGGLTSFYGGAITEPLRIFACLGGAWFISWRLTLASLIFAPLAAYLILFLNRQIRGLSRRMLDRSMGFHHVMLEVFGALVTVQAYSMEEFEQKRFCLATSDLRRNAIRIALFNALTHPVTELLGMGMLCTGLAVSSYLVLHQETTIFGIPMSDQPLSVAAVTVFFGMLIGAADPLRKLSGVIAGVNNGMAAATLVYPLLDCQSQIVDPADPKPIARPHRSIEFRDASFSYDGQNDVLHRVDLIIPAGERLAIVGHNGSGKSTLTNLLCRFYDPQQGSLRIDGIDVREVSIAELRSRVALVSQQTELFNETILHNIRYGCWHAAEEEVVAAAKLARAHDFISSFPEGYQTVVGANGERLSGGQRQRIALARAFLKKADILILDEATSQIDVDSERLIHDALKEFGSGRTLIMISHRESMLSLATRIVRMEHGSIMDLEMQAAA